MKVKALVIAPYEGLAIQIKAEAGKRNDIDVVCHTGDLYEGLNIAKRYMNDSFDIIISRGGTATLLKENGYPVIDVSISLYDLLRSIRQASGAKKKFAIVGFDLIMKNVKFLKDVLAADTTIETYTIQKAEDAENVMQHLSEIGIEIVVCDQVSAVTAGKYRLNYILINSGSESILAAINQAVEIGKERIKNRNLIMLHEKIVLSSPDTILLLKGNKILNEASVSPVLSRGFLTILKAKAENMRNDSSVFEYDDDGLLYSAKMSRFHIDEDVYVSVYIKKTRLPFSLEKTGIAIRNSKWAHEQYLNSFYGCTNANSNDVKTITNYSKRNYPVFIYGERGTGKGNLAQLLYYFSQSSAYPLFDIDMQIAGGKATEFIRKLYMEDPEKKAAFHLKNINKVNQEIIKEIIDLNEEFSLSKRAYIIATATLKKNEGLHESCIEYIERLQCLTLNTMNLRDHLEEISSIANLYIATLNRRNGTEMISIDEEGIKLLEEYDWPGNNDQLARVLKRLNATCSDQIIQASDIRKVIQEEKEMFKKNNGQDLLPEIADKTLKEIDEEIIKIVLAEEKGNKSNTAKRLGLSRATVWRALQDK